MKLAKVNHYRCGQPAGKWGLTTYVWVPDDMSEHEFGLLCSAARDKYLDNEILWKEAAPVQPPGYLPNADLYPDTMTIGEMKANYEAKAKECKDYQTKITNARKNFSTLLVEVSNGAITQFWNEPTPMMKHDIDWGHQHGVTIDMSPTKLEDFPPSEDDDDYV